MSRKTLHRFTLAVVTLALVVGCGPFVEVVSIDKATAKKHRTQVQVYDSDQLKGRSYKVLQPLEGISCKSKLWDPSATEQDATDQLMFKAAQLGANGLLNMSCGGARGTSLNKNCWETITCNAAAIQVQK